MKQLLLIIASLGIGYGGGYFTAVLGIKQLLDQGELIRKK